MDLSTFITETLVQIVSGVADAQTKLLDMHTNARINPALVSSGAIKKSGDATSVEFDVAITVSDENTNRETEKLGAKVGFLSVISAGLAAETGGEKSGLQKNQNVSRIKFEVQLAQPADIVERRPITTSVPRQVSPFA